VQHVLRLSFEDRAAFIASALETAGSCESSASGAQPKPLTKKLRKKNAVDEKRKKKKKRLKKSQTPSNDLQPVAIQAIAAPSTAVHVSHVPTSSDSTSAN